MWSVLPNLNQKLKSPTLQLTITSNDVYLTEYTPLILCMDLSVK